MSVRVFVDGDYVTFPAPPALELAIGWTVAAAFKRSSTGTVDTIAAFCDDSGAVMAGAAINAAGHPYIFTFTDSGFFITQTATAITIGTDYCLCAWRSPGSSPGAVSFFNGTTWQHVGFADTNGAPGAMVGGSTIIGRFGADDTADLAGQLAVVATWNGTVVTAEDTESLAAGDNITWGNVAGLTELWEFNQASWGDTVTGQFGVSDSSEISGDGTTDGDEPPSGIYVVGVPWLDPPLSTVLPLIEGTVQPEQTVECTPGSWRGFPTGFAYQWFLGGDPVSGETESTYTVVNTDVAHDLSCEVTATNTFGDMAAESTAVLVLPKPLLPAPATVLVADSFAPGGWSPRTVRYVNGDEWT